MPEDNQLTAELVDHYAEDNVVMVTWANNHYYDFVSNWVRNVRKCGVSNFMVGAMDNELLAQLIDVEVPTFAMQSGMITTDFGWGTLNFHKMGRKKIELIYLFTQMGFDILVSDVDTAWPGTRYVYGTIPAGRRFDFERSSVEHCCWRWTRGSKQGSFSRQYRNYAPAPQRQRTRKRVGGKAGEG